VLAANALRRWAGAGQKQRQIIEYQRLQHRKLAA